MNWPTIINKNLSYFKNLSQCPVHYLDLSTFEVWRDLHDFFPSEDLRDYKSDNCGVYDATKFVKLMKDKYVWINLLIIVKKVVQYIALVIQISK